MEKDKFIALAMKRFKIASEAEHDNRKKGLEVDSFSIELKQWPDQIQKDRDSNNQPCLVLDQTNKFLKSVTNEQRMNRPQIKISPTSDDTVETAEILEGMVRHIQVDSAADIAYDTACDSQTRKGWGYFRLLTVYSDPRSFDQDAKIVPIRNAYTVYLDPDRSDPNYPYPKWGFVVSDIPTDDYKKRYPKSQIASINLETLGDEVAEWMKDGAIRVAEYWCVEEETRKIYQLQDGSVVEAVPEGMQAVKERDTTDYSVCMYKINAVEKLTTEEWAGKYIPIIEVVGEDHDVNGKRVLNGMIGPMMDEQRQFNYWSSASTEAIALAPKAPFILAEGQQSGYEGMWRAANQKNFPYLIYKPVTIAGTLAPPPQRNTAEPPVQAMMAAIAQASQNLKSTTGIYDASLGNKSNETSGKAIMARKAEGDVATFNYVDNLSRALRFLGVQLLDLIPRIYDTARIVRIVHEDGTHEPVQINQPFMEGEGQNAVQKIYDVTTGKYDVVVNTGPSFQTKRVEAQESMGQLVQSFPEVMHVAGDLIVKNFDWPGAADIADRLKKMLPPQLQDQEGQQIPPAAKQQLDQSHAMVEQLTKALNDANDKLDAKTLELKSKERIAEQDNETKLVIAEMQTTMDNNMMLFREELAHLRGTKDHVHGHQEANTPPPVDPNRPTPAAQPDQQPPA